MRIGEGLFIAVIGGLAVALIAGDGARFSGEGPSTESPSPSHPSATSPDADEEFHPRESTRDLPEVATLQDAAAHELRVRSGTVGGRPVPPSPHFALQGSQCDGRVETYKAALAAEYAELNFVAALDDDSPLGARVAVEVLGDGRPLEETAVAYGTSGTAISVRLEGVEELAIVMTALTRSADCVDQELQLLAMDGVLR